MTDYVKNPEEIPDDIKELLEKEKKKQFEWGSDERDELFEWLSKQDQVSKIVMSDEIGFSRRDYQRMMKAKQRRGYTQDLEDVVENPEDEVLKSEGKDFKDWLGEMGSRIVSIGQNIFVKYYTRAAELGYTDPESGKIDLEGFISDAVDFYIEKAPHQEMLEDKLIGTKAAAHVAGLKAYATQINTQKTLQTTRAYIEQILEENPELEEDFKPLVTFLEKKIMEV